MIVRMFIPLKVRIPRTYPGVRVLSSLRLYRLAQRLSTGVHFELNTNNVITLRVVILHPIDFQKKAGQMYLPGFQLRRTDYALASLRRASSKPIRPIPRREIAAPESGTAPTALLFAENENSAWSVPLEFWVVNIQLIFVGVNPLPLTMPVPSIVSSPAFCVTRVEEERSKVKPPTNQRAGVDVDGLNIYGVPIVAWVPGAIAAKMPVLPLVTLLNPALPNTSNQVSTLVAVAKEVVSNATEPAN
jgi:hypothetical protein